MRDVVGGHLCIALKMSGQFPNKNHTRAKGTSQLVNIASGVGLKPTKWPDRPSVCCCGLELALHPTTSGRASELALGHYKSLEYYLSLWIGPCLTFSKRSL